MHLKCNHKVIYCKDCVKQKNSPQRFHFKNYTYLNEKLWKKCSFSFHSVTLVIDQIMISNTLLKQSIKCFIDEDEIITFSFSFLDLQSPADEG